MLTSCDLLVTKGPLFTSSKASMVISLEVLHLKSILVKIVNIKKMRRLSYFNCILIKSNLKINKMHINSVLSDVIAVVLVNLEQVLIWAFLKNQMVTSVTLLYATHMNNLRELIGLHIWVVLSISQYLK
jgi:hypothetical protein